MSTTLNPAQVVEELNIYGPMKVADFGSGAGHFAIPVAKSLSEEGIVYAFDVQEPPLEFLRKTAKNDHLYNVKTIRADLEAPEGSHLAGESVDFVIVANILFQAPDKQAILNEAFRILKKNGRILVVEWDADSSSTLGPPQSHRVPKATLTGWLMGLGLSVDKDFVLSNHHYGIVAKK
ncbi:MAG: class I SAM-dependent methyltransferase [bacterium]|nr:class I SAM-dependent methyltransferase [bacterium]